MVIPTLNDDFFVNVRLVIMFNVSVTLMDKIYNFALNYIQQAQYVFLYYMLKKLLATRKGVDIASCPPP